VTILDRPDAPFQATEYNVRTLVFAATWLYFGYEFHVSGPSAGGSWLDMVPFAAVAAFLVLRWNVVTFAADRASGEATVRRAGIIPRPEEKFARGQFREVRVERKDVFPSLWLSRLALVGADGREVALWSWLGKMYWSPFGLANRLKAGLEISEFLGIPFSNDFASGGGSIIAKREV
jgi:hypothetical protein